MELEGWPLAASALRVAGCAQTWATWEGSIRSGKEGENTILLFVAAAHKLDQIIRSVFQYKPIEPDLHSAADMVTCRISLRNSLYFDSGDKKYLAQEKEVIHIQPVSRIRV